MEKKELFLEYKAALLTKKRFYKSIVYMLNNINDDYDYLLAKKTVDFAFPGFNLDRVFEETIYLEIHNFDMELKSFESFDDFDISSLEKLVSPYVNSINKESIHMNEYLNFLREQENNIFNDKDATNDFINSKYTFVEGRDPRYYETHTFLIQNIGVQNEKQDRINIANVFTKSNLEEYSKMFDEHISSNLDKSKMKYEPKTLKKRS